MPRIIVTSRYLDRSSAQKSNYVRYIATREGVAPTVSERENYIGYLANRSGAVKFNTHGLFSQTDEPIVLDRVVKAVANHKGNVWTHVVSLRRNDAQAMGYDNLTAWRNLVIRQIPNIAKHSKNDIDDTELINLVIKLQNQLKASSGKKVYGYLKLDVKKTVDEIFMKLSENEQIKKMYDLWCEMEQQKHDVYSSAKIEFPHLIDNKEFRAVKNMIIQTVMQTEIAEEIKQGELQFVAQNTVLNLFANLSRCIEDDYHKEFKSGRKMIDHKLRKIIHDKKQALGIKEEQSY